MKKIFLLILCGLFLVCGGTPRDKNGADGIPPVRPDGTEWEQNNNLHEPLPDPPDPPEGEDGYVLSSDIEI